MIRLPFETDDEVVAAIPTAREVVGSGGVILIPTESFYGLGGDPSSDLALSAICAAKRRPLDLGVPVLASDWGQVESLVVISDRFRARLSAVWPGAMTAVLPALEDLPSARNKTLAVRIPGHPALRALMYAIGPLTGTSANAHGSAPSTTADEALQSLHAEPELLLDGGTTAGGAPSTLVDLTTREVRILRPGKVPWEPPLPSD